MHENYACDNDRRNLLTFYLAPEQLQSVAAQIKDTDSSDDEFRTDFYRDNESLQKLTGLHRLLNNSSSNLEKQTAFIETLALLIKRHAVNGGGEAKLDHETERVKKIIALFHEQMDEDIGLSELATEFNCTPYHLICFSKKRSAFHHMLTWSSYDWKRPSN